VLTFAHQSGCTFRQAQVQPLGRASPFHAPFVISQQTGSGRMKFNPGYCADAGKLDAVEQLVALAQEAGLSLTHPAMAFAIAHPGVTSARARWNSSTMRCGRCGCAQRRDPGPNRRDRGAWDRRRTTAQSDPTSMSGLMNGSSVMSRQLRDRCCLGVARQH